MNIKTILKSSVAAAALFAIAAPVAPSVNAADDTLSSGNKNSLKISGYVARSIWYGTDSESDAVFISDGTTSETRVRWTANGTLSENVTVGSLVEMEVPLRNKTGSLNLGTLGNDGTESPSSTNWGVRHTYIWVKHKKMGKLSLGHTNAASNGKSETTFSGTNMLDNTDNVPFGGGIFFLDTTNGDASPSVSTVRPGTAFTNLDGQGRQNVIRYDTPRFAGLSLMTSYIDQGDWDVAGDYRGKFGGVRVRVQAQYSSFMASNAIGATARTQNIASVSAAALHDSGVNAAFAYGKQNRNGTGNAGRGGDPQFWYFNIGYRAKIFGVGGTNFSFNWNHTEDNAAGNSEGDAVGFTVAQLYNPIGANMVFAYRHFTYDTTTNSFEDIDVFGVQTLFNF